MIDKEILKTVKRIEISTRSVINNVLAGAYHSTFKGKGMEFSEVREYFPGDDVRAIDWNVTARTGTPHIKKYVEERELSLMLVVDASSSADFGSKTEMKGEVMATISALLAFSAIKNNDKVGLLIFTSKVELFIPPAKGKKHVMRVVRELLYFKPEQKTTDMTSALEYLAKILNRKTVVMLISDFQDANFDRPLRILRKRHDLVAISVTDPRELEMPDVGFVEFEDPETGETLLVDTGDSEFRSAFAREALHEKRVIRSRLRQLSVDYVNIVIEKDTQATISPLVEFFRRRAREASR
jgi:uncharacterized protein (DUF58 family)